MEPRPFRPVPPAATVPPPRSEPSSIPEPKLKVVNEPEVQEMSHADMLAHTKERLLALSYSLAHRRLELERETTLFERLLEWADAKLRGGLNRQRAIELHIGWVSEALRHLNNKGAELSPEELERMLKEVEDRHYQAIDLLAPDIEAAPAPQGFDDLLTEGSAESSLEDGPLASVIVDGAQSSKHGDGFELGQFGQDGYRLNKKTGTVIQWDGNGSYKHSLKVAELGARRIDEILSSLPDTSDHILIESYIRERWNEIALYINEELGVQEDGAFVMTAIRPLKRSGKLVVIRVGDCEAVLTAGGKVRELVPEHSQKRTQVRPLGAVYRVKSEQAKSGRHERVVSSSMPELEIIDVPEGTEVTVYQASDGIEANTDQRLVDIIRGGGLEALRAEMPSAKDDTIIVETKIQF